MLAFLSRKLIELGSKIKPKTAKDMLNKAGINNMDDLKNLSKKDLMKKLNLAPKTSTTSKVVKTTAAGGAGVGGTLGTQKFVGDVKEEMEKSRMAGGGMVKKRAKTRTKKSRGTGAAIRGTKFKGVF